MKRPLEKPPHPHRLTVMSESSGNSTPDQSTEPAAATGDLEFGEVQTKSWETTQQPPSSNGHFAVQQIVSGHAKSSSKSPPTNVFVDLDTMLDMQEHAVEDISVELGGILLGYRGALPDGTPFVVINDSLRARYYKATRGSFKFTHETWADLNQQRAALPESTEIVGWYHTHPGWGVFLSDMDVFICDHFFAGPDDVALVIDPTSGDTGLFVRRDTPAKNPPARLSSYQIYAHRKCGESLQHWANYFSGGQSVSNPNSVFPGRSASPVFVSAPANDSSTNRLTLLLAAGIIGSQLFLGLLFYSSQQQTATEKPVAQPTDIEAREAIVDQLISSIAVNGPQSIGETYRQVALNNSELKSANLGLMTRINALEARLAESTEQSRKIMLELETVQQRLSVAQEKLTSTTSNSEAESAEAVPVPWWRSSWMFAFVGLLVGGFVAAAGTYIALQRNDPAHAPVNE